LQLGVFSAHVLSTALAPFSIQHGTRFFNKLLGEAAQPDGGPGQPGSAAGASPNSPPA
jgi:hypothetical protein